MNAYFVGIQDGRPPFELWTVKKPKAATGTTVSRQTLEMYVVVGACADPDDAELAKCAEAWRSFKHDKLTAQVFGGGAS